MSGAKPRPLGSMYYVYVIKRGKMMNFILVIQKI